MAGEPGFEPGIAGPKPAALPLGYAPLRPEYKCRRASARPGQARGRSANSTTSATTARIAIAPIANHLTMINPTGISTASAWEAAKIHAALRASACLKLRAAKPQKPIAAT